MLRWCGKYSLKSFFVKSHSKEGKTYKVELWGDGTITCECLGGTYRRTCPHSREKRTELEAIFGGLGEAVNYYRELKKKKNE